MREDNLDREAIESTLKEMNRIQAEIQRMVVVHMLGLKSKLSKDQQTKFLDLIEEAMADGRVGPCSLEERD